MVDVLRKRFPTINEDLERGKAAHAQIVLRYSDNDGDEIEIEDSQELLEAYRYGNMNG